MKRNILTSVFVAVIALTSCGKENAAAKIKKENLALAQKRDAEISKGSAEITFDKEIHDFGNANEGDVLETTFFITNSGKKDLVILEAKATCGCTIPNSPKGRIAPGATKPLGVKFNTRGKKGKQTKTITLYTNTSKGNEKVKITAMVKPKEKN